MFDIDKIEDLLEDPIPNVKQIVKKYARICIAYYKADILDEKHDTDKLEDLEELMDLIEEEYEDHETLAGYLDIRDEIEKNIEIINKKVKRGRLIPTIGQLFKMIKFVEKKSIYNTTLIVNNRKKIFVYLPANALVLYTAPETVKNANYKGINLYDRNTLATNLMKSPSDQYRNLLQSIRTLLLSDPNKFMFGVPNWMNINVITIADILGFKKTILAKPSHPMFKQYKEILYYVIELYNGLLSVLKKYQPSLQVSMKNTVKEQLKLALMYNQPLGSMKIMYNYSHFQKQYKRYKRKYNKLNKMIKKINDIKN